MHAPSNVCMHAPSRMQGAEAAASASPPAHSALMCAVCMHVDFRTRAAVARTRDFQEPPGLEASRSNLDTLRHIYVIYVTKPCMMYIYMRRIYVDAPHVYRLYVLSPAEPSSCRRQKHCSAALATHLDLHGQCQDSVWPMNMPYGKGRCSRATGVDLAVAPCGRQADVCVCLEVHPHTGVELMKAPCLDTA